MAPESRQPRRSDQNDPMHELGTVGLWTAVLDFLPAAQIRDLVQELEGIGWPTLWRPETVGRDALVSATTMLEATTELVIATGIAQIYARHPQTMRAAQRTLHESSNGRFLLGIGVSHAVVIEGVRGIPYTTPYSDMVAYLKAMSEAPFMALAAPDEAPTVIAALGPKMLALAATAADGAHPYFSPVEHTAFAREVMGGGPILAPEQMVVIDSDRERGTATALKTLKRYLSLANYTNNLKRFGFTDDEFANPSPRLIDAVVAIGDVDAVVARIRAQHASGASHVAVQVLHEGTAPPMEQWRLLADALELRA